jgi:hypothetical protein
VAATNTSRTSAQVEKLSANNLLIVLILITLIVVGVTGILGKNLVKTIIRDTKVVNAKQKADQQLTTDLDNAPSLISSFQSLGSQATIITDSLPVTSDLPGLISTLENMAGTSGVRLKSVDPTQTFGALAPATGTTATTTSTVPVPQTYVFTVNFEGNYAAIQKLLGTIEISARPILVQSIQLIGTGNDITGTMNLQTYYQSKAVLPISQETIK